MSVRASASVMRGALADNFGRDNSDTNIRYPSGKQTSHRGDLHRAGMKLCTRTIGSDVCSPYRIVSGLNFMEQGTPPCPRKRNGSSVVASIQSVTSGHGWEILEYGMCFQTALLVSCECSPSSKLPLTRSLVRWMESKDELCLSG